MTLSSKIADIIAKETDFYFDDEGCEKLAAQILSLIRESLPKDRWKGEIPFEDLEPKGKINFAYANGYNQALEEIKKIFSI